MTLRQAVAPIVLLAALGGCAKTGDIDLTSGVGITAVRSACPVVGVPAGTGDITLFDPATSRDSSAIDVVADISNVRSTCDDSGEQVLTTVTFDVRARRSRADGPRDVTLPYFITIVRAGNAVVAKRVGRVGLHFDAGQTLASTSGQASTTITRAAATLSPEVRAKLNRKRKAGQEDAAVDPLSAPDVRQAVLSASFEALVGFQLTEDQLKYNAQR
ncbi:MULTISPECIES: hypothetical protein [unclassified Sphingomonas]|uniref:hypothetical protein n=1 Tax=unclassified Sphingomonas TaxID=196159 RepID=UPI000B27F92D|nr:MULTISPECIES: hypothetical protein [unclassified Sphingomonas]MBN8849648.1 hypothetical protein [Sphingomonas sp.]MBS0283755.1 hypothetical protein [Pseudomonadota bacterium]